MLSESPSGVNSNKNENMLLKKFEKRKTCHQELLPGTPSESLPERRKD